MENSKEFLQEGLILPDRDGLRPVSLLKFFGENEHAHFTCYFHIPKRQNPIRFDYCDIVPFGMAVFGVQQAVSHALTTTCGGGRFVVVICREDEVERIYDTFDYMEDGGISAGKKEYYEVRRHMFSIQEKQNEIADTIQTCDMHLQTRALSDDGMENIGIFNPIIDENKLATCFLEMYQTLFGHKAQDALISCDEVNFTAYLLVLTEKLKLGNPTLSGIVRTKFYQFVQTRVIVHMDEVYQTFYLRIKSMCEQHNGAKDLSELRFIKNSIDAKNFNSVLKAFNKTQFGYCFKTLFQYEQ